MFTLLALDTSTEICTVALSSQGNITSKQQSGAKIHGEIILPTISQLLDDAKIKLNDLDAVVVGIGPGSFTGVRIATSIAQGLAFGLDIPVVPISTLTTLAYAAKAQLQAKKIAVAIDARMDEIYACVVDFSADNIDYILSERVINPELFLQKLDKDVVCIGNGWENYPLLTGFALEHSYNKKLSMPDARYMLQLGADIYKTGNIKNVFELEPVYLRNNVAWKKIK